MILSKRSSRRRSNLKIIILLTAVLFFSFSVLSISEAKQSPIDILVFSPHPDDETLACGGTILKAVQDNKKVCIVFLTNGDGYSAAASAWLKKGPKELAPEDYIVLGEERQKEALRAIKKLGLDEEDAIFLSYPDKGLAFLLWKCEYKSKSSLVKSETTKRGLSPYIRTYNRAKRGYSHENIVADIKDILKEYKPKRIFTPHPLDVNQDHQATTRFVYLALERLRRKHSEWIDSLEISYYLIHSPTSLGKSWPNPNDSLFRKPSNFSQQLTYSEKIINFKYKKAEALKEYHVQLELEEEKRFFKSFIKDNELFWNIPVNKTQYLRLLDDEWENIGRIMCRQGYNVNFGVVADVVSDIDDFTNPLVKKERVYADKPGIVSGLAGVAVKGMQRGGIIPVVKHFPGLGRCYQDTHHRLPIIQISKEELYKTELLPFKELIEINRGIWIMVDHAIYTCLSNKPASLSYEIQTELLRKELGFEGIIITDELLNMQAIKEYALKEKIKEPYIGQIVVRSFQAGADMVILYPQPGKTKEQIIRHVIETVKDAVKRKRLSQADIDSSVKRILKEKEKIFHCPLEYFLEQMSLEEKIAQKIMVDAYHNINVDEEFKDVEIVKKFELGGVYAYHPRIIEKVQNSSKIPLFVAAEHEGGQVSQYGLGLSTRSAYIIGKEFSRVIRWHGKERYKDFWIKRGKERFRNFNQLDPATCRSITFALVDSLDELIELWSKLPQLRYIPNPNHRSPLTIYPNGMVEIKSFGNLPIVWLRRFPDEEKARCAYQVFEEAFQEWSGEQRRLAGVRGITSQLEFLKKIIQQKEIKTHKKEEGIRLLCLAAHPDDEDGEALVCFGKKFNCETYILLATRGEGGENHISSSLYKELGFLRTEEMERAASVLGVKKVYYLGKEDFGYCLDPKEAFKKWNRQDTLKRLVYFYRLIRPHVIITKHNKFNSDDHCQHRALAILAEEAFDLAGDPKVCPEMIEDGLLPWQPLKLYERVQNSSSPEGSAVAVDTADIILPENKTIHQIAVEALKQHCSQGDRQWLRLGESGKVFYQLIKSKVSSQQGDSFFDEIKVESTSAVNSIQGEGKISPSGLPGARIVNNLRIGLIEKHSNILFIAFKTLGCDFKSIDEEFLKAGDLSQFDTIIVGQGVYTALPTLIQANERLLNFVKNGGNLVVFTQYNRQPIFPYAPYPLRISFNPITNEDTPITVLIPEHPLFNFPNKISAKDFEGWVQDRGIAFPFEYSDKYTELTRCPSPLGKGVKGGYLVAHYGKGSYIYTTYAWYRQLREFHLGAYKNLSNMIAYYFAEK